MHLVYAFLNIKTIRYTSKVVSLPALFEILFRQLFYRSIIFKDFLCKNSFAYWFNFLYLHYGWFITRSLKWACRHWGIRVTNGFPCHSKTAKTSAVSIQSSSLDSYQNATWIEIKCCYGDSTGAVNTTGPMPWVGDVSINIQSGHCSPLKTDIIQAITV